MRRVLVLAAVLACAAAPAAAQGFSCELADERLRYIEVDSNTDERDFEDLMKRAAELGARALDQRQSDQLARIRQDIRFIRKVATSRMAELTKEMDRVRRAGCSDQSKQEALFARVEAAAQKIMQGAIP